MKSTANYTEDELLHLIASGSKEAFEIIYKKNFISVFYFANRFVADKQAAEDITTEIFLKLWERLSNFNNLQSIKSFLLTSVKNACINYNRSDKRALTRNQEFNYLTSVDNDDEPFDEDVTGRIYQYIFDEIEKLPTQLKKVFKMAYLEGMSNEQIAKELDINNQSVRNHKVRALKALRGILSDKDVYAYFLFMVCMASQG